MKISNSIKYKVAFKKNQVLVCMLDFFYLTKTSNTTGEN